MAVHCSKCDAEIADTDFNVATDVAYCRVCKTNFKFSELVSRIEPTQLDPTRVPKHVKIEETPQGMRIVYKKISPIVLFLLPFTCVWSGGSMAGIYVVPLYKGTLTAPMALFGLPFLIGTVVLTSLITFLLFGRWIIVVDKHESFVSAGVGPIRWKKTFDLSQLRTVSIKDTRATMNDKRVQAIELKFADDKTVSFGSMMDDNSKRFIAEVMATLAAKG